MEPEEQPKTIREKYPLDADEESTLTANLAFSQAIMLVVGCLGVALIVAVSTGDWFNAFLGLGWARAIATTLAALPVADTLGYAILLGLVMFALDWFAEQRALQTTLGRESVLEARRGINGELPRVNFLPTVLLLVAAGCAEELLFRYVIIYGCYTIFDLFMPTPGLIGGFVALVLSSFVFWLAHVRYRDFVSTVLTLILAVLLGAVFMLTGSLAVVVIAHAGYDIAEVLHQRYHIKNDDDYFGGPAPKRVLLDEIKEEERHINDKTNGLL